MKMHKNAATFEILTPPSILKQQLLNIERAGRTCYRSENKRFTEKSARKFIQMLLERGHESVIEHSSMTVKFEKVSRGFTHELVRHRIASFSQESTRYVDYAKEGSDPDLDAFQCHFIVPPHRDEKKKVELDDGTSITPGQMFQNIEQYYRSLRKAGWTPEDARQILPIAIQAQIVMTANFREWRHVFTLRTAKPAHWEIRSVMCKLLKEVQTLVPGVFDDFKLAGTDANGFDFYSK